MTMIKTKDLCGGGPRDRTSQRFSTQANTISLNNSVSCTMCVVSAYCLVAGFDVRLEEVLHKHLLYDMMWWWISSLNWVTCRYLCASYLARTTGAFMIVVTTPFSSSSSHKMLSLNYLLRYPPRLSSSCRYIMADLNWKSGWAQSVHVIHTHLLLFSDTLFCFMHTAIWIIMAGLLFVHNQYCCTTYIDSSCLQ